MDSTTLTSKTIVLTGASDGIGAAAADILAQQGHRLIIVGRSKEKTENIAKQIGADQWFLADYEKLSDVRALAENLRKHCPHIDVLVNNAGGLFSGPVKTGDGFERTFQVNHLASFLLTNALLDILIASQAAVINTSSIGARLFGNININDLNNWDSFTPNKSYGDTKLANILFAKGLHNRYHAQGLAAVAFHPGNVATHFASDTTSYFNWVYQRSVFVRRLFLVAPAKGGQTLAFFANGEPGRDWQSGEFYGSNCKIGKTNPQAYDEKLVLEHWEHSAKMLETPSS
jgi:NAD(P)-dependent dehydrogenase (short-subunit alcohol dehydrogenase family)